MFLLNGYIRVYTGKGQGKTTSSFGAGLRAVGAGYNVFLVQFLKSREDSALNILKDIDGFTIERYGREGKLKGDTLPVDYELAEKAFEAAEEAVFSGEYDLVIMDEVNVALDQELIDVERVLGLIEDKPVEVEVILTGRYAHPEVIDVADLVTEMHPVKHYLKSGVEAREGFDY
ncbi:cob(I)yrinic acid a,c-diamide adenosyltransferase [Methanonatronarchaeum sp. AMET6-2]|uniref:cob(I)yrinic acid a,c-diamide adenosyltransferase n=1 Tax=Methanonatronarchaeum sp. AMET6-2 TaxID=2933293 RepID=UPI0012105A84|nr:MAG: cob(I)yrinic acid a,c-diamide adenosyltransferase [Methanonatronarchaeia archaeon]